jgi:pyruvate formate lyase activating enzyme
VRTAPEDGEISALGSFDSAYALITALAVDPVEKKPLYHWRPGSQVLSAGFAGCNLCCPFCQNWRISQTLNPPGRRLEPEALAAEAVSWGQIAYTYSEPLVHFEYLLACMKAARESGTANILVSNGCCNEVQGAEVLALTDAANIDLKCFSDKAYAEILGGSLAAVKAFITLAVSLGVHVELTTLVVPGLNDGEDELDAAAAFIAGLGEDIPWHLSAYHPDWNWDAPPTDPRRLSAAVRRARNTLRHVYTGNVAGESGETPCLHCGAVLVRRSGYRIMTHGLREESGAYFCTVCGEQAPFRG